MPTYLYRHESGGSVFEWTCRMGDAPQCLFVNGALAFRDYQAEQCGSGRAADPWSDHKCLSLAVHPADRAAAIKQASELGVPTHFDEHGLPEIRSRDHKRRLLKAFDLVDLDSYY